MRNELALGVLLLLVVLGLGACGERPQRVAEKSATPAAPATPAPKPADGPARFAGTITLDGGLADAEVGAIFVSARRKGQRLPTLSHKYEMTDPAWSKAQGRRELRFSLGDVDNMGGFGAPMGPEMEVEARYSPSGFIDPKPGSEEAGSLRASVPASPGDSQLSIRLQAAPGK